MSHGRSPSRLTHGRSGQGPRGFTGGVDLDPGHTHETKDGTGDRGSDLTDSRRTGLTVGVDGSLVWVERGTDGPLRGCRHRR